MPAPVTTQQYLIALGSNRRHHRHGAPEAVLAAALEALVAAGLVVENAAPVIRSAPLGPGGRRYANSAVVVAGRLDPAALLAALKAIEAAFGRRGGRRWGPRVLDLDIIAWDGGRWRSGGLSGRRHGAGWLVVPHPLAAHRHFVLTPALAIAPLWRVSRCGVTVRQMHARLTRARPAPR